MPKLTKEEDDVKEDLFKFPEDEIVRNDQTSLKDSKTKGGVAKSISNVVRWISNSVLGSKERKQYDKLLDLLEKSTMFRFCTADKREQIANHMTPIDFKRGDILMHQNSKQENAFVIVEGQVTRKRLVRDQVHTIGPLGYRGSQESIGMLHLLEEEPTYSTVIASTDGVAFILPAPTLRGLLEKDHVLSNQVIHSLVVELRHQTYVERTPLFLQQGKDLKRNPLNFFAVSVAASIESFYRSGLNAILISQLTGKPAAWFPNMHIQMPSRVLYINGFKGLRYFIENQVNPNDFKQPQLAGLGLALVPGIIMTPVSSILEACNVTHMNNEPLMRRWTRGLIPRTVREVIFGVGINQLSDFCEERVDQIFSSPIVRNFAGSLLAGGIAGYLSHVPHNLSTLKLVEPHKRYGELFATLREPWLNWYKGNVGTTKAPISFGEKVASSVLTVGLPKGCLVRTAQISGSFIIINATINALKNINVNVTLDSGI